MLAVGNVDDIEGLAMELGCSTGDRPRARCIKCVPKCASARVAPSNIVYYCTDIDPQGKVN